MPPTPRRTRREQRSDTIPQSIRHKIIRHTDLYYTHVDDETVPVPEFLTALNDLVTAGKGREVGASNISPSRLREALAFSEKEGISRYGAVQPHYNLVVRDLYEGGLAQDTARHGLAVVPYFALAKGFLTGKYRPGEKTDSARSGQAARYLDTPRGRRVLATLHAVAAAHHVQPATVALAWLAARPTVTAPLASARTLEQLGQLLAFSDITLSQAELDALTAASD
ncbi:aldo/keto reductase [Streptomyces sp. MBT70]|nr:aldo/keto reductase [Streptomyces sp. MBT70]GGR59471.1 hypothetical protein GCM10010236_10150 [Streptomyces eurythermus]